jgi:hypothetical protein
VDNIEKKTDEKFVDNVLEEIIEKTTEVENNLKEKLRKFKGNFTEDSNENVKDPEFVIQFNNGAYIPNDPTKNETEDINQAKKYETPEEAYHAIDLIAVFFPAFRSAVTVKRVKHFYTPEQNDPTKEKTEESTSTMNYDFKDGDKVIGKYTISGDTVKGIFRILNGIDWIEDEDGNLREIPGDFQLKLDEDVSSSNLQIGDVVTIEYDGIPNKNFRLTRDNNGKLKLIPVELDEDIKESSYIKEELLKRYRK